MVIYTRNANSYIQYLLRVDGSIFVGVFLMSFFCVVPESSYTSNAANSSQLVHWSSNCSIADSSIVASFKKFCTKRGGHRNWQLFSSLSLHVDYYCVHYRTLYRLRPHRAHKHVVLSHYSDSFTVTSHSLNWFDITVFQCMGFISLHAKPHKTHVLCIHDALLGLLNSVDCHLLATQLYAFILYRPCISPRLLFSPP